VRGAPPQTGELGRLKSSLAMRCSTERGSPWRLVDHTGTLRIIAPGGDGHPTPGAYDPAAMPDGRPHPKKELEEVLQMMEARGWRILRRKKYFRGYCPCGDHMKSVHISPSGASYRKNLIGWLQRQPCWD
jgi:hypothetical protein